MSLTATVIDTSRARARNYLSRGGVRAAELSSSPGTHRLILMGLPLALQRRFDETRAGELDTVFEMRIRDPRGGHPACFALHIAGGTCAVSRGPATRPGAGVEVGMDDIIRLVTGSVGWPTLLAQGRLQLSGDPFLALRFPLLFRLAATGG
jgi:SCP-2 sterol transfer family